MGVGCRHSDKWCISSQHGRATFQLCLHNITSTSERCASSESYVPMQCSRYVYTYAHTYGAVHQCLWCKRGEMGQTVQERGAVARGSMYGLHEAHWEQNRVYYVYTLGLALEILNLQQAHARPCCGTPNRTAEELVPQPIGAARAHHDELVPKLPTLRN